MATGAKSQWRQAIFFIIPRIGLKMKVASTFIANAPKINHATLLINLQAEFPKNGKDTLDKYQVTGPILQVSGMNDRHPFSHLSVGTGRNGHLRRGMARPTRGAGVTAAGSDGVRGSDSSLRHLVSNKTKRTEREKSGFFTYRNITKLRRFFRSTPAFDCCLAKLCSNFVISKTSRDIFMVKANYS